jgi:hypothetical protein
MAMNEFTHELSEDDLEAAVSVAGQTMKLSLLLVDNLAPELAKASRKLYQAYLNEGFTEDQAIQLMASSNILGQKK